MVRAIEDYRFVEAKMTDDVISYTTRLLRQSSSVGEMQLLKQRILLSDENGDKSIELDELKRFEESGKSYLRIPHPVVKAYLESLLGTLSRLSSPRAVDLPFQIYVRPSAVAGGSPSP